MQQLLEEAGRLPDAAVRFARGISQVWTPGHLVPLRGRVRTDHRSDLLAVHEAINQRFGTTGATSDYVNVFYAASEMAVMAEVGGHELSGEDKRLLRRLWEDLLAAT
ncbi:MAG: hypothetical protein Q8K79_23475 [Solirubrobacteraceae bacterium]|nr:hypothetical protein [Solirubrobacteraceae bacterium]